MKNTNVITNKTYTHSIKNIVYLIENKFKVVEQVYMEESIQFNKIFINISDINLLQKEGTFKLDNTAFKYHTFHLEKYICIYAVCGNNLPYNNETMSVETLELKENQNQPTDAVLSNQKFILIDKENYVMYTNIPVSHKNKIMGILTSVLKMVEDSIELIPSFKNLDEFLSNVEGIKEVSTYLVDSDMFHPHMFNKADIFDEGDADVQLIIRAKSKRFTSKIKDFITLNKNRTKKLRIVATDKKGKLNKVFTESALYESLTFAVEINNNGMYKANGVFNTLKREIERNV